MHAMRLLALIAVLITASPPANAKGPAKRARLVIVDNSGSMAGKPITAVKDELTEHLKQLPPSADHPFVLISFASAAKPGIVCTDLNQAIIAIGSLKGDGGGTSIAAGLRQGYADLQRWTDAEDVMVMLYTDFEDGDRNGIQAAEKQLDRWFGARSQTGKTQSVYVKRWGNSSTKALLEVLGQSQHVKVVEVIMKKTQPVTIDPSIAVKSVKRKGMQLTVELTFGGRTAGRPVTGLTGQLTFSCPRSDVMPQSKIVANIGAAVAETITVPVPAGKHDGKLVLPFVVGLNKSTTTSGSVVFLPVLATSRIEVPIAIPRNDVHYVVTATPEMKVPPRWADPIDLVADYPMTLVFEVPPAKQSGDSGDSSFRIDPQGNCRIAQGSTTFTMTGPGTYRVPLVVQAKPVNPGVPLEKLRFRVALNVTPVQVPPNVKWQPASLLIDKSDLPAPDPQTVLVESKLSSVDRVRWRDLQKSVAVVDATVAIEVLGKIPEGAAIALAKPAGVESVSMTASDLRAGRQQLRVRITGVLPPAPQRTTWNFRIVPTASGTVGVELMAKTPLLPVTVIGPRKTQLFFSDGKSVTRHMKLTVSDNCRSLNLPVVPIIRGLDDRRTVSLIKLRLSCPDRRFQMPTSTLRAYRKHQLKLQLPSTADRSFFSDQCVRFELGLAPERPLATLEPARASVVVVQQAPFKRLLVYLSISLCALGAITLLIRLVLKLRETPE
jgi:hypothetical protein